MGRVEDAGTHRAAASRSGYRHPLYAESQRHWGRPRRLARAGGWLLERAIPGTDRTDAMGCYPLFACEDWSLLAEDLADLGEPCVAASLVVDPFAAVDPAMLGDVFTVVRHWKDHFVVDLPMTTGRTLPPRHRRNVAFARRHVAVEVCGDPWQHLDEWCGLYASLCGRHSITGLRAFSRESFAMQLRVPGLVALRAVAGDEPAGMHLWFIDGDVAYGHLGASTRRGYELMAAYALYATAIDYFRGKVRWLHLGGSPGNPGPAADGLWRFKRGWATGTLPAYFCGKVLDAAAYSRLATDNPFEDGFFPVYRGRTTTVRPPA